MKRTLFEKLHHETPFMVHITQRDAARRFATVGFILLLCGSVGAMSTAIGISVILLAFEAASSALNRVLLRSEQQISDRVAISLWLLGWVSFLFYFVPTISLVQTGSLALIVAGYMWMFGLFVYTSNTFSLLPFYNWSMMIPAFAISFPIFWLTASTEITPSEPRHWVLTAGLMMIYAINTFETMNKQKDTADALKRAQGEGKRSGLHQ